MPVSPTYPGVYIEEVPSSVRTIPGVATSITAFIGRARWGPVNDPIRLQSFAEFDRQFGGLWEKSTMSYAVQQYFQHGGRDAIIVRVHSNGSKATICLDLDGTASGGTAGTGAAGLELEAANPGKWGNDLRVIVDHRTRDESDEKLFNLRIELIDRDKPAGEDVIASESFPNLSVSVEAPRSVNKVLEEQSQFVCVAGHSVDRRPLAATTMFGDGTGSDGDDVGDGQISADSLRAKREGLYALDKADLFNLLCIPPPSPGGDVGVDTTLAKAAKYCKSRRAMLIVDPPSSWKNTKDASDGVDGLRAGVGTAVAANAAVYFPRLNASDPLKGGLTREFTPCGAVAGIFARTDAQRGIWKAPAGMDASFSGVRSLGYKMTDGENGQLSPLGVNCLRTFPVYGNVLWGARTLAGADRLASEWKYVPVRRLALYIEESLYRGTQWVVFEPNDEPLWAQIRLNVGAFMHGLFRKGAFQGMSPKEAYFVKCDRETTTQDDINRGIVNILVGFAPLKPAEFVIIKISQIAGEVQT